ncbi:MAG: ABC transporter permease [Betaproteobacteria bacterium TMED82]|nr:MAG: ABC transporter permease [Betaproteobacteria bacterium TMED82]|tara:strand:+ start:3522 stop:4289 length:768 start_codon:yes stop_codon:yes gene_type:complete
MNKLVFLVRFTENLGAFLILLIAIIKQAVLLKSRFSLVMTQVKFLGNRSLSIICVSGLFVGLVLGLQGYYTLRRYGSEEALGLLVALSLVRELGPVVASLLFAGRAGTSLTAEIGLMKAGEQLSALEAMGVDPLNRVLLPRFIGGILAVPILCALFSSVGIVGGWFIAVILIGVDSGAFWSQMTSGVNFYDDILSGFIKSFVFGVVVTHIALFMGYFAKATPDGVSKATTSTVVVSSFSILSLDFILTALMFSNT